MSIIICDHKPAIKRKLIKCDICKLAKHLCIRSEDKDVCRSCWKKDTCIETIWCVHCESCAHIVNDDDIKTCSDCNKNVGTCCGRLYHCQSTECICRKCYDYKCNRCDTILNKHRMYISDTDEKSKYFPICKKCRSKIT